MADDTNQTGSALRGLATATYDLIQHPYGNASGEAPPTPAAPKPPEGTIPPVTAPTQDTVKTKYKLPPSADLSKPFLDPANKDVQDAAAFSQASQEFNPPPAKKSLLRRAAETAGNLSGITAPSEGTASPVTGTDVAGDVAGLLAGGVAEAAIQEYAPPIVRGIADRVSNWRVARDAAQAAEADAHTITLKPSEYNFSDIGGKEVAPARALPAPAGEVQPAVNLETAGATTHEVGAHPNSEVVDSANRYNATRGGTVIDHKPAELDAPEARAALADKFEALEHNPNDPAVKKSYDALKQETLDQFKHAQEDLGIKFDFTEDNPYENAEQMTHDVRNNKHLAVYSGGNELPEGHPLAEIEPTTGQPYNNIFRATHDIYGHAAGGNEFTEHGEEAAYNAHQQMYSPEARPAVQNETQGQSNWYFNNKAVREGKPAGDFAQQKAAVLPPATQKVGTSHSLVVEDAVPGSIAENTSAIKLQDKNGKEVGHVWMDYAPKAADLPSGKTAEINHVVLDRDLQGQGLGARMYEKAIENAKTKGFDRVVSDTDRTPDADRVWQALSKKYPVSIIGEGENSRYVIEFAQSKPAGGGFSGALREGSKAANTPDWVAGEFSHEINRLENILRSPEVPAEEKDIARDMLAHTRELAKQGLSPAVQKSALPEPIGHHENDLPYRAKYQDVDFSARDLQDSGKKVTEETIRKDYADGDKTASIYQSHIPIEDLPSPKIVEEEDGGDFEREEYRRPRVGLPIKVEVKPDGSIGILDGNHRLRVWEEQGQQYAPAWVVDRRHPNIELLSKSEKNERASEIEDEMHGAAESANLEYKGSMEGKSGEVYHTFDDPARPGDQINVKESEIPATNVSQFLQDKMAAKRAQAGSNGETVEQMRQRLLSEHGVSPVVQKKGLPEEIKEAQKLGFETGKTTEAEPGRFSWVSPDGNHFINVPEAESADVYDTHNSIAHKVSDGADAWLSRGWIRKAEGGYEIGDLTSGAVNAVERAAIASDQFGKSFLIDVQGGKKYFDVPEGWENLKEEISKLSPIASKSVPATQDYSAIQKMEPGKGTIGPDGKLHIHGATTHKDVADALYGLSTGELLNQGGIRFGYEHGQGYIELKSTQPEAMRRVLSVIRNLPVRGVEVEFSGENRADFDGFTKDVEKEITKWQSELEPTATKSAPATQPLQPRQPEQEGIAGTVRDDIHHEMGHILVGRHHGIGNIDGIGTGIHPALPEGSVAGAVFDFSPWGVKPGEGIPVGTVADNLDKILDMYMGGGAGEEATEGLLMSRNPGMNSDIRVMRRVLAQLEYSPAEITAKIKAAQQRAKQILIDSSAPDIMKKYSVAREEGLPVTHHMSQERVEELVREVQNAKQKASEGRSDLEPVSGRAPQDRQQNVPGGEGRSAQGQPGTQTIEPVAQKTTKTEPEDEDKNASLEEYHGMFPKVSKPVERMYIEKDGQLLSVMDADHFGVERFYREENLKDEDAITQFMNDTGTVRTGMYDGAFLVHTGDEAPTNDQFESIAKTFNHFKDEIDNGVTVFADGKLEEIPHPTAGRIRMALDKAYGKDSTFSPIAKKTAEQYHPDLQKMIDKWGTSDDPTKVKNGASFINPDGTFTHLGNVHHDLAIMNVTGQDASKDPRPKFINDTGAVRVRYSEDRAGQSIHISIPEQGVTPEQISAIRQSIAQVGRYGNLVMERADVTPGTKDALSMTKEFPRASDTDAYLKQIQAHPDPTAKGWDETAAARAAKEPAGGVDPITGKSDEKGIGAEFMPEVRQPLDHPPTAADFQAFYEKNKAILSSDPSLRIGWDNNSKVEGGHEINIGATGEGAVKMARKLDQREAWDISKSEPISTGGEGLQTAFPNYPVAERLKDLHNQPQSNIQNFENLPAHVVNSLNDDLRTYLSDKPDLQKRILSELHKNPVPVQDGVAAAQAGADLNGWWRRYIGLFNRLGDAGVIKATKAGVPYSEILKQWHAAVSGNKNVEDANNLAFHSFIDWLDAGEPTDRASIDAIVRQNGAQPEGSGKRGNAAISDTRGRTGKIKNEGIDTSKLFSLVNSPEMRGEKSFGGKIYSEEHPIKGKGLQFRKIPSMGATVAGEGDLSNVVVDTHMFDFLGLDRGTESRYIANSVYLTKVGQELGLPAGEAQEQIWGTVIKFKNLLKDGLTPEKASDRIMNEGVYEAGKDYSDIILNDPEVSGKGGVLDRLKNKYGIGNGSEGISALHESTRAAEPARASTTATGQKPINAADLANVGQRLRGTIPESKIKKPKASAQLGFMDFMNALKKPGQGKK